MSRRRYNLPPLTTLSTFETAARNLSFKLAAEELNVTPGAVSHQVKALERDLKHPLFARHHRHVELTEAGELLYKSLSKGFSDISETLNRIKNPNEQQVVTIAATTAVSSLWLTPRLAKFWKNHHQIPVNQLVSDFPSRSDQIADLTLQYGGSIPQDNVRTRLFSDILVPVCSPELAKKYRNVSLEELARLPLIHMETLNKNWTSWRTWFSELGYHGEISSALKVNNYTIALQAAKDDSGIVLGWNNLISPLLEDKALVPFTSFELDAPSSFHIVSSPTDELNENTKILRAWLLEST